MNEAKFEFLLRMGDNALILSHRLSEWCGKAPVLEEDIALANTALDLLGQAQLWLGLAGETEGAGRSADDLAYLRDVWDFRNVLLVEQPNGDFGTTIMRQLLFDLWHLDLLRALSTGTDQSIAAIAEKSAKEASYHLGRSTDLVIRLGDGTDESHARMQAALDLLYPYVGEMFGADAVDTAMDKSGILPRRDNARERFDARLADIMTKATVTILENRFAHAGGRDGRRHSEHLGHILTEMQWLQRAYPGAAW